MSSNIKFQFIKENQHDKRTGTAGNPDSCPRRTHYGGYCELYPVRQGKGLFSDRAAGYGDREIECGEEVGVTVCLANRNLTNWFKLGSINYGEWQICYIYRQR